VRIFLAMVLSLLGVLPFAHNDEALAYQWFFNSGSGHYYTLTENVGHWTDAVTEAQSLGGYLVTINDAAEEAWLRQTFDSEYTYWIGFTDGNQEGNWVWVGDPSSTYTNWAPGEPNNMTKGTAEPGWEKYQTRDGEHFAIMNWIVPVDGEWKACWNDVPNLGPWFAQAGGGVLGIVEATYVPLPGSFWLFSSACGLLALLKRR